MKHFLRTCAALAASCLVAPAVAQTTHNTSLTSGLVTWLPFEETTGTRALDASGTGKSGTLVGGGTWETARTGRTGKAIRLTPGQYVSIPLAWQPRRFSIAWWVNADSQREWNQTIRADYNGSDWGAFLFHTASDGRIYVGTTNQGWLALPAGTFQTGVWQHFAFTYDNGEARLYKDGALLASGTNMPAPVAWNRLTIGHNAPLEADGQYDDFRVYDRALSSAEVMQVRNTTTVAPTPPSVPADNFELNWSFVRSFDGTGNVIGESKSFSDALGRPTQAQAKNMTSGHVLATQTINNSGGKGALSTLPAPINNQDFSYKSGFITTNGSDYKSDDFEGAYANSPKLVDQPNTPGTLGYYYSLNNELEPLTATTRYPYSISEEYAGPLGGAKRSASPGDEMRLGGSHNTSMREFPLLNDLDHYLSLRPQFVAGTPVEASLRAKGEKAVSIDVNGRESVVFTDADGKTLASCLTGPQYLGLVLTAAIHSDPTNVTGLPQYQDIHIPAAGNTALTVTGTGEILLVNLLTDATQTHTSPATLSLAPGFYRVVSKSDNQALSYQAHYGDFSYSFYDDAGRTVATMGPKGVGDPAGATTPNAIGPLYISRNTYSGTGTLLATESTDEGRTEYVYARDGRIRFSQSPVQRLQSKFSYSNYDEAGRVVESGEYTPPTTVVGQLEAEHAQTNGQVQYNVPGAYGGQDVGYLTEVGRYVLFQGYVGQNGPYALDFRYSAAGTTARTMSLYIDGVDVQQLTLPATNSWTTWATQRAVVNLTAGGHTVMLRMDADDSGFINLDYLLASEMTQGQVFESLLPVVKIYEAENANTGCGTNPTPGPGSGCNPVATNHTGYHGSGFIGDLTQAGRFVEFTVNVPAAGRYPVHIRYAAEFANSDRSMPVYINGSRESDTYFAPTNSWSRWETQTISVDLTAGNNLIRFQHDGQGNDGWINIDYIEVVTPRQPAGNSVLNLVEELMPTNGLNTAYCSQRNQVWYDLPVADSQLGSRTQEFVLGAVTKTSNGSTTSWYSYDELGRLMWLVQEAPGVGVKTVDYTYDLTGSVLEVAYQKGQPDAFYHHYEYDADQRLRAAYTSADGLALNRTLQARYFYYLHGPLKRVELGDRLQGIDYAYTIQGWVKSINQANRSLDPSADKPTTNGFYKDLFGLTLDYFSGDYQSRQLTLPQPYIATNQNEMRHDGTVRASSWFTPASATTHAYAYRYDAKGQLTQADYGQMNGGSYFTISATNAYEEGNLSYDAHGNIQTLRRRDGMGATTDDFLYDYTANTNKLATVKSRTTNNAVLSYQYDANGQMIRETEAGQGDKYLTYDVTGKVTGVYRDEAHQQPVATFAYNDRGYRTSKTSYTAQGVASKVTYYVTDNQGNALSTYEQPAGGNVTQTEIPVYAASRVGTVTRLDDGSLEPRYELNDQLGNARVVFRKPVTKKYTASMENSEANQEEKDFDNLPATRVSRSTARSGFYVARLKSPLTTWGPTKELQMQKGDTLTFSAYASYFDGFTQQPGEPRAAVIAPYLAAGAASNGLTRLQPGPDVTGRRRRAGLGQLTAGLSITGLLHAVAQSAARTNSVPLAGIRLRVYEGSSTTVAEEITIPVTAVAANGWEMLRRGYRMPYAGRIEVTTYNYDNAQHVYFDDFEVEHSTGLIVQEQHQYAFGSPITGLNYTVGDKMYRHGYQGQYAEKDEETGWDNFELRMYNARIGRWTAPDPYGQFHSPYVGMGNNPVTSVDPDGGWSGALTGMVIGAAAGAGVGGYLGYKQGGIQGMWGGMAMGAVAGGMLGGAVGNLGNYASSAASSAAQTATPMAMQASMDLLRIEPPAMPAPPTLPVPRSILTELPSIALPTPAPTVAPKVEPTVAPAPTGSTRYLDAAKAFTGRKYGFGAMGLNGGSIDCSGLVNRATGHTKRVWGTSMGAPPGAWTQLGGVTRKNLLSVAQKGDLFVWPKHHTAFYNGNGQIFHANGNGVTPTNDLLLHWVPTYGVPNVYRPK